MRPGEAERLRRLRNREAKEPGGSGGSAEAANGARDVPAIIVVPGVDRHRDAACDLGADGECGEGLAATGAGRFGGGKDGRPGRRAGVEDRRKVRVVVVLEVREVAVDECGLPERRAPTAEDRRCLTARLAGSPRLEGGDGVVLRRRE